MLRAHLRDSAVAAAKGWSHEAVEPRHLAFAICEHLAEHPEVEKHAEAVKRALEPRGTSIAIPTVTEETDALLQAIRSPADAIAALARIAEGEGSGDATAVARDAEADVGADPDAEPKDRADADADTGAAAEASEAPPAETVQDVLAELDRLIGLTKVKEQVQRVIAVVQANQTRVEAGHEPVNPGLHLVFSGAPGTGKTTVARLVARLYAASGALPGAKFEEVGRSDLIAGYVGQTAIQTAKAIEKAVPGVLFIDEAYALTPTHDSDYGAEAIATLVKAMEDHRHELAVIVAGYPKEMSALLEANPGLRSRLKTFIDFPDYGPKELVEIFTSFVNSAGIHLSDEARSRAESLFEKASRRPDFGNARFARSLFESAYARMALRAAEDGKVEMGELMELAPDDLEWKEPGVALNERSIGFGHDAEGSRG